MFEIIATIGQKSCEEDAILALIRSGATMLRYNLAANLGYAEHERRIKLARRVLMQEHRDDVRILFDIPYPGAKIRLGMLPLPFHEVKKDTILKFRGGFETGNIGDFVPVQYEDVSALLCTDQIFTIGDGELAFRTLERFDDRSVNAVALNDGILPCVKSINTGKILGANLQSDEFSDLGKFISRNSPDAIAFSFVETIDDTVNCLEKLHKLGMPIDVTKIAKIESPAGLHQLSSICDLFNMLIVARGDLALSVDFTMLGVYQRKILNVAKEKRVPCILSTQLLESVNLQAVPNRSEISDVSNAVFSGYSGVMLAKETSSVSNPDRPVAVAKRIIEQCQRELAEPLPLNA